MNYRVRMTLLAACAVALVLPVGACGNGSDEEASAATQAEEEHGEEGGDRVTITAEAAEASGIVVAQAGPREAVERGDILRHLVEQTFDGQETILAGDVVN